ncbi:kynureninase [Actinorhabdospora filicis]|uniref:Kynureninase n=1 Tax=Actinorhabdospora filicis TaxID=1785913 RepID=A0A9W6SGF6_9ACTN|nr:kynureninase [Actinorhabdospora filicis]GLZ75843.1 kynureninase [Actinorhabdospora filicis]
MAIDHPLSDAADLDAADPLASHRDRFVFADPEVVYLDGNSLGRAPKSTREAILRVVDDEWSGELIAAWDHWIDLSRETGDLIAGHVVEAHPGEVIVSDSTSVNLYKLAAAALDARPGRKVLVTDDDNFPTDRYILQGLAAARGMELRTIATDLDRGVDPARVAEAVDDDTALLCLSHVSYRSGAIADMAAITADAHAKGALVLWDLCHSAGAVPVPLASAGVDLAVGCTYKYLNGGPGAPAFLYVRRELQTSLRQPIWGWFGQRDQFAMGETYEPVDGVERFQVGTPPVIGVTAVREGVRIIAEAGMKAIREKSLRLTEYADALCRAWLEPIGFTVVTPAEAERRGGHVTVHHPEAWRIAQAMRDAKVVPDYRSPDRIRLGLAPLYTRFADVHEGLTRVRDLVTAGRHLEYGAERGRVT